MKPEIHVVGVGLHGVLPHLRQRGCQSFSSIYYKDWGINQVGGLERAVFEYAELVALRSVSWII